MPPFLVHTFSGSGDLDTGTPPDTGTAPEVLAVNPRGNSPNGTCIQTAGQCRGSNTTASESPLYRFPDDPGSDEYYIEADFVPGGGGSRRMHVLCVRMTPTGTGFVDHYQFRATLTSTAPETYELIRVQGGTETVLASSVSTQGNSTFRLTAAATGPVVTRNGAAFLSSNDTSITQRGRAGMCQSRGTSTIYMDNAVAEAIAPSSTPVDSDLQLDWNVTATVDSDIELDWNVSAEVASTVQLIWDAYLDVISDSSLRWAVAQSIDSDLDLLWNVSGGVESDIELQWDINSTVQADIELEWDLYQTVESDIIIPWDTLGTVESDLEIVYDLSAQVAETLEILWDYHEIAEASLTILYGIEGSLTSVDSDLEIQWGLLETVDSDTSLLWDINETVDSDLTVNWGLYETVDSDLSILYDLESPPGQVDSNLTIRYNVLVPVDSDLDLEWGITSPVESDVALLWDITDRVDVELTIDYAVNAAIDADLDIRWNAAGAVDHDLTIQYDVEAPLYSVESDLSLEWGVGGRVSSDLTIRWNILTDRLTDPLQPILEAIRDLLYVHAQFATLPSPFDDEIAEVPQAIIATGQQAIIDSCCPALAWVRVMRAYPTMSFPNQAVTLTCPPTLWAAQIELGITRCSSQEQYIGNQQEVPMAVLDHEAEQTGIDRAALIQTVICAVRDLLECENVSMGQSTPYDYMGNCYGQTVDFTIMYEQCCDVVG